MIEKREYHTNQGLWTYFTLRFSLDTDRLMITTLDGARALMDCYDGVQLVYLHVDDRTRLLRYIQRESCQERLSTLNEEKLDLETRRTAQNKASQEMNENLLNLERSASRLEQKLATSGMEEKQILDRLWEHYELSHSAAMEQRVELESTAKAARRVSELKREISALGTSRRRWR